MTTSDLARFRLSPAARDELRGSWAFVLTALVASVFGAPITFYWFGVAVDPLVHATGWTHSRISAWMTVGLAAGTLLAPPIGIFVDRAGGRAGVILSIMCSSLGLSAVVATSGDVWVYYATAVIVYGTVTGSVLGIARLINGRFKALRGTILGLCAAGASVAGMVMPRLLQAILDRFGVDVGFYAMSAAMLVPLPFVLLWLHGTTIPNSRKSKGVDLGATFFALFSDAKFWYLAISMMLFAVTATGMVVNLVPFLTATGMSRSHAALFMGGLGLGALVGKVFLGAALDRVSVVNLGAALLFLNALSVTIIALAPGPYTVPGIVAFGLTEGGVAVALPYCVARLYGLATYATAHSGVLVISTLGTAGPVLFSYLRDISGSYRLSLYLGIALSLLAALSWGALGRCQVAQIADRADAPLAAAGGSAPD